MTWETDGDRLSLERESGPYQVFIRSLGNRHELMIPFLRRWIAGYETAAAIRYKVEQDIKLVRPTLVGLSKATADDVAGRLNSWGANAAVFHGEDENRPQFNHNRYGLILLEIGRNRQAVQAALQAILGVTSLDATNIIDSAPKLILENVSVDQAIEAHEQLLAAGVKCELSSPEPVWFDTSMGHISRSSGSYLVILQYVGPQITLVGKMVGDLLPHLSSSQTKEMLTETPVVLLRDISLETAELVKLKLEHFAAIVVIQETAERAALGSTIHPQNPDFGCGHYTVILKGHEPYKKVSVIQEIRKLRPAIHLTEIVTLLDELPVALITNVDKMSAAAIRDRLEAAGAAVRIDWDEYS